MKKQIFISLLSLVAFLGLSSETQACTRLLAGRNATVDGSTLITYAADAHTLYGALNFLPDLSSAQRLYDTNFYSVSNIEEDGESISLLHLRTGMQCSDLLMPWRFRILI